MGGHINSRTYWWPYRMFACNNGFFVIVCYCHTFTHYFQPFLWVGGIRWFLPWGNDFGFCYSTRLILQWILSISPKKEIQYWRIHETSLKKLQITFNSYTYCVWWPLYPGLFGFRKTKHLMSSRRFTHFAYCASIRVLSCMGAGPSKQRSTCKNFRTWPSCLLDGNCPYFENVFWDPYPQPFDETVRFQSCVG